MYNDKKPADNDPDVSLRQTAVDGRSESRWHFVMDDISSCSGCFWKLHILSLNDGMNKKSMKHDVGLADARHSVSSPKVLASKARGGKPLSC